MSYSLVAIAKEKSKKVIGKSFYGHNDTL